MALLPKPVEAQTVPAVNVHQHISFCADAVARAALLESACGEERSSERAAEVGASDDAAGCQEKVSLVNVCPCLNLLQVLKSLDLAATMR